MKFYDLEGLAKKCGTDNKYDITVRIAARARWLSEHKVNKNDERYLSMAFSEVDKGHGIPAPGDAFVLPGEDEK